MNNGLKYNKKHPKNPSQYLTNDLETSSIVLPGIINTAMEHGVDIAAILQEFGISLLDLKDITQSAINLKFLHAIVIEVEKASQISAIALRAGEDFDFEYLPHLKTYLMSSTTLREAYQSICRIGRLISPILTLNLEQTKTDVKFVLMPHAEFSYDDERHYVEMVFSTMKTIFSKLLKTNCPLNVVTFRHKESDLLPIYEESFHCRIVLDAPENAMFFDPSIIDAPLPGRSPEMHCHAEHLILQQLIDSPVQKGLVQRITWIMKKHKHLFTEPIEEVARCLCMSSRTLQRRLKEEGVSFIELKDQIKFKIAVSALKSGNMSIEEISEEIGFSDRHSFTNAFKRRFGMTPSVFRKKHSK